jgi:hypothetical protein
LSLYCSCYLSNYCSSYLWASSCNNKLTRRQAYLQLFLLNTYHCTTLSQQGTLCPRHKQQLSST